MLLRVTNFQVVVISWWRRLPQFGLVAIIASCRHLITSCLTYTTSTLQDSSWLKVSAGIDQGKTFMCPPTSPSGRVLMWRRLFQFVNGLMQVGLALQPQHLPCEGTCASLVPCSHPVQAPVFPTRNSCLLCPFDTRACATTLMLFFSAKDFPADKMVLGSGKRLLGFVPSHRDSLVSALLLFLP